MKTKGKGLSQLWKRNAVVAAIALFVCAAVYLNWSYEQEAAGKTLGESTLVGSEDPLLNGTSGARRRVRLSRRPGPVRPARTPETTSPPPGSTGSSPGTAPLPCSRTPPGRTRTRP